MRKKPGAVTRLNRALGVRRREADRRWAGWGGPAGDEFHWTGVSLRCPGDICGGVWWALGSGVPARDANVGDVLLLAFETVWTGER